MKRKLIVLSLYIGIIIIARAVQVPDKTVYSDIVRQMGYEDVMENPCEVVEFTIPENFSPVYEKYNNLLKESGYDLSGYKGKKCVRYTYLIPSENARANIIVCGGKIIGGDVSGITLDGIMIPIKSEKQS